MYFIEFIIQKLSKKKQQEETYNPITEKKTTEYESCEHIFMPIDSTNETLSCTKCGFLIKKNDLKNKNFFLNKDNL